MLEPYFLPIFHGSWIAGTVGSTVPDARAGFVRDRVTESPPVMVRIQAEDFGRFAKVATIRERVAGAVDAVNILHRHGPYLRRADGPASVPDSVDIAAGFHRDDGREEKSKGSVHKSLTFAKNVLSSRLPAKTMIHASGPSTKYQRVPEYQ